MSDEPRAVPTFVVVGHVNKGKSSVVATLTEDGTIPIDWVPGTTREAGWSTFELDGEPVFRLVDTPGFQEAAAALAWMRSRAHGAAERRAAVTAFVEAHRDGERFRDEVALLEPLLAEAGILYVVDAARPYRDAHEAEMEILRWTGRPGIALLNRIGEDDHGDEWREVLQQYFSVVRDFDAHAARFRDRMGLLRAFAEVREDWRAPLEHAAAAMEADRAARDADAAAAIGEMLVAAMAHVEWRGLAAGADVDALDAEMASAYRRHLRELEERARARVERIYRHHDVAREEGAAPDPLDEDLFHEDSWRLFGLTRTQLLVRAAAWGGAAGGAVDLAVGGLSLGAGVLLGAASGAALAWFGGTKVAAAATHARNQVERLPGGRLLTEGLPGAGHVRSYGPVANPRFAWVLADRALTHWGTVRERAHARQDALAPEAEGKAGFAATLPEERLRTLDRLFRAVSRAARAGDPPPEDVAPRLRDALVAALPNA
jgi:hypothetical protein